ncbi:hypothetical protein CO60_2117 [Mycobacterium tuberculosis]|nr:hypothetical protein MTBK_36840 [Mycobacterium tuberculosis K]ALA80146.1 Uncharacterized protein BCGR_3831 [Mycobacterium tuberculosis variant bovis BCG]KDA14641.1 hypothetical protein CO60_2117 [Mycobacterium tuberculosis]BAL67601.1 hypothetical protein ERDMAN_3828 [Mycobacterium tuberculosis str. Erdman = ATCC 35801]BAQ07696.1 hypothetical protein KURONO_3919 [Mycobacterium tuberculosis str. Kurono]
MRDASAANRPATLGPLSVISMGAPSQHESEFEHPDDCRGRRA